MERFQLQQYRSDRRKLLEFILSSGLVKDVLPPPGSSSSCTPDADLETISADLETISADYVLTCAKSGGVLDVSEATKRFYRERDYPIMINLRSGSSYFFCSEPETSGSPPLRMPPDVQDKPDPSYKPCSSSPFDDISSYTGSCVENITDSSGQLINDGNLPTLNLPALHTDFEGLSDDDVRETAYEVFLAIVASTGVPIYLSEDKQKEKKSKLLARRRSKTENTQAQSVDRHSPLLNMMRMQMEISEAMDECTRKCLMQYYSATINGHIDVIQIPLGLLNSISSSNFLNHRSYMQWHRRQVNILEEILYSSAEIAKDGHTRLRAALSKLRNVEEQAVKKVSSEPAEVFASVKSFASKLSRMPSKFGLAGESCYWTSCYHLNIRLYEKLLLSVFDNLEEGQLVEEAEEILVAIRLTWSTLGITAKMHHTLYGWVLLKQFIITGESMLLELANFEIHKVVVMKEIDAIEKAYLDSLTCSIEEKGCSLRSGLVDVVLSSITVWCDGQLKDYHWHFRKKPKCFEKVLTLAEAIGMLSANLSGENKGTSTSLEEYVENSIQAAYKRVMDDLNTKCKTKRRHLLAVLAEEIKSVAEMEATIFSPVLNRWCPKAIVHSSLLLHRLYGEELKPFLDEITELSEDARSVLPVADILDRYLMQLIESPCQDTDTPLGEEFQPYQIGAVSGPLILHWVSAQHGNIMDWTERAFNLEEWSPLSSQQKQAASIIEVFRILEETVDQFFGLKLPMDIIHLHSLLFGISQSVEAYLLKLTNQIADKNHLYPPFPPLTRYKEAANPFINKKTMENFVVEEKLQEQLNGLTTKSLCVKLNTLHYTQKQIRIVEDSIRKCWTLVKPYVNLKLRNDCLMDTSKHGKFKFYESAEDMLANFNSIRKIADVAIRKICDFIGAKVMFWDLRDSFLLSLYKTSVENARLENCLEHLDDALDNICDLIVDDLRDPVVFSVCQASFEMCVSILLDGGPSRAFCLTDIEMMQEDLNLLKEFFMADGEGLPRVVVEKEAKQAQQILDLYSLKTGDIIEMLMNASEQITVEPSVPKMSRKSPEDADTLLRILCHKKDKEASKFLKKQYQLPKSCDYEDSGEKSKSILKSPVISDLLKRNTSFHWNEKGRRSLRTIKKKFQGATS